MKRESKPLSYDSFDVPLMIVLKMYFISNWEDYMIFNGYAHFKNYCLKVIRGQGLTISDEQIKIFNDFEESYSKIFRWTREKKISSYNLLDHIAQLIVRRIHRRTFESMKRINRKIDSYGNGKTDSFAILKTINNEFEINITFNIEFLKNGNIEDELYPDTIEVLQIEERTIKEYLIPYKVIQNERLPGIYFIYNEFEQLVYIGKSVSCALSRSFDSLSERKLDNFSKIEIYTAKSVADIGIYEAYFIAMFRPPLNQEFITAADITIELPPIPLTKTITRDEELFKLKYVKGYILNKKCSIENFLEGFDKDLFFNTPNNKKTLNSKGIQPFYDNYYETYREYDKRGFTIEQAKLYLR